MSKLGYDHNNPFIAADIVYYNNGNLRNLIPLANINELMDEYIQQNDI